jgi:hypothetical protein
MNKPLVITFLVIFLPAISFALLFVFFKKRIIITSLYRRTHRRRIIERAKSRIKRFDELNTIPFETKEKLRPTFRNCEVKLASLDIIDRTFIRIAWISALLIFLTSIGISIFTVTHLLNVSYSSLVWIATIQLSILIWGISVLIIFFPFFVFENKRFIKYLKAPAIIGFIWLGFILIFYLNIIYRIFSSYRYDTPIFLIYAIFIGLILCFVYLISLFFTLLLISLFRLLLIRPHHSIYPEAFLVDGLLQILNLLEKNPNKWIDLPFKRKLMLGIEKISTCIETDIVSQLSTSDIATDFWLKQTFVKIASGIRSLKKGICTPKTDTYNEVTKFIANTFINIAKGDWDNLTQAEPEKVSKPKFITVMTVWLRVLTTGIVPLVGLWIIQKTSLAFEGEILNYLRVGGYIWAAITFLTLFDPLISEKIAAIKDIISILPRLGKGKNKE